MTEQQGIKKQIIFVDDDEKVLEGLKRGLRSKRAAWDMSFFLNAHDALQFLEERHVNVVISDMLMPTMNGAEFLEIVRKKWPKTLRMVLSGELSSELVPRARAASHQVLAKPCSSRDLVDEICRAISSSP